MHIEILKWFAIVFMALDHIGFVYDIEFLRFIGRMSFPLFGYILVYNYLYHSSNKKKYIFRLFLFSVISQPFYNLLFDGLNIFFSLTIALSIIYLFEQIKFKRMQFIIFIVLMSIIVLPISIYLDYKIFGLLMILSFYYYLRSKNNFNLVFVISSVYLLNALANPLAAVIGCFSIILILLMKEFFISIKRINKWIFYVFYPLHLLILYLLQNYWL